MAQRAIIKVKKPLKINNGGRLIVSETEYNNKRFTDEQIGPDGLEASVFFECEFKNCSFQGAILRDCRFVDSAFLGSDLSLVEIPGSTFSNVHFEDSKIIGVNWSRANWTLPFLKERISFSRSVLDHSTFLGLKLRRFKRHRLYCPGGGFS